MINSYVVAPPMGRMHFALCSRALRVGNRRPRPVHRIGYYWWAAGECGEHFLLFSQCRGTLNESASVHHNRGYLTQRCFTSAEHPASCVSTAPLVRCPGGSETIDSVNALRRHHITYLRWHHR